jgi:hypothetical protein
MAFAAPPVEYYSPPPGVPMLSPPRPILSSPTVEPPSPMPGAKSGQ